MKIRILMDFSLEVTVCGVLSRDEVNLEKGLAVRSYVNGELRQNNNTKNMIHGVAKVIVELTQYMTLEAGTIIAMGTPAGVGMGMNPPQFLRSGDIVRCEIEDIGYTENRITD